MTTKYHVDWRDPDLPAKSVPRLRLVPFDEIEPTTEPAYLVKGLIPREGLTVVWGPPKCGKSFWVFDLVMHVTLDWPYRDHRVQAGPVVYIAAEGAAGFRSRVEAFRQKRMGEAREAPVPFYLVPVTLDLIAEHRVLIAEIRSALDGASPVCVVVDTLNRTLRGSESADEDMAAYIAAGDAIREAFGCAVVAVHHCGIDGSRPRGHTSLTGAADAQIAIKRDAADNVVATVEWMKDGTEGETIVSRLAPVEIGTDTDGDVMTSCIVEEGGPQAAPGLRLNTRQRRALDVLQNILADHGSPAPETNHYPAGAVTAPVDLWREHLFQSGVLDPGASNPRADFKRVREGLADKGATREWNGLVWVVDSASVAVPAGRST